MKVFSGYRMNGRSQIIFIVVMLCGLFGASMAWSKFSYDDNYFSRATRGLPEAREADTIELKDGDVFDLDASYVVKEIGSRRIRMIGYNGTVPGPFIHATQGSTVTIRFTNRLDIDTTVHSHGIRIDFPSDGTPGLSQPPIHPGETFAYTVKFPDAGTYWYHPHIREDYAQELGLAGNYVVEPTQYTLPQVDEEVTLVVDDILFNGDQLEPIFKDKTNFAIMGRFGNVMLVNGKTDYRRTFRPGEVVRFNVTNVANARPFELSIPGARIKRVGSDLSPFEHEEFIDTLLIAPSERYIVDVYFPTEGKYVLTHRSHDRALGEISYPMATFEVSGERMDSHALEFETLHAHAWVTQEATAFKPYLFKKPDRTLRLYLDPGTVNFGDWMAALPCHRMPDGEWMGKCTEESKQAWLAGNTGSVAPYEKIHWEDHMFDLNKITTNRDIAWQIIDESTREKNEQISDWKYRVGDTIKLRVFNDPLSAHPMQHPFHMHGQRLMVLAVNGKEVENKVWKDTVLIQVGDTVDMIVEFSNPGLWMAHCHIAEHLESGMMFTFAVGEQYFDMYDTYMKNGMGGMHMGDTEGMAQ